MYWRGGVCRCGGDGGGVKWDKEMGVVYHGGDLITIENVEFMGF